MPRRTLCLLLLALLAGCPVADDDDSADPTPLPVDEDQDGSPADEDCDDGDPAVHPGATEVCNGVDDDCDEQIDEELLLAWYADTDGDGFGDPATLVEACEAPPGHTDDATDCDDADPAVHPDATEVCNELDDDCDGVVDEDVVPTWYIDADADGFGDADRATEACAPGDGWVDDATDCDDLDPASFPGATEVCDLADNDCDGQVDEEVTTTWYADADGDGHGDPLTTAEACAQPAGHEEQAGDCDDGDPAVNPNAVELCDAGTDNDCDGLVDEDDAADAVPWYLDSDSDGFGDAASPTSACAAPADHVADATDCDDQLDTVYPGAPELCDGEDNDCDGEVDVGATDADEWYLDHDGDGVGDDAFAVTACLQPVGYASSAEGVDCDDLSSTAAPDIDEVCDGEDNDCDGVVDEDDAIDAPTWYPDVDADGFGDAAAGAPSCVAPADQIADGSDCDDGDPEIFPGAPELCVDGIDTDCDLLADADDVDACPPFVGWPAGPTPVSDLPGVALHGGPGGGMGNVVAEGDVDGDGLRDVLVGDHGLSRVYLFYGAGLGATSELTVDEADVVLVGEDPADWVGWRIANGGDVDGDGLDDLLVGAWSHPDGGTNAGKAYLVLAASLPPSGELDLAWADYQFVGAPGERLGSAVALGEDVDGDGLSEVLLGAYTNGDAGNNAGKAYLYLSSSLGWDGDLGSADADYSFAGEAANDRAGVSAAFAGDVDGDGLEDLLIGGYNNDAGGNNAGRAYLVLAASLGADPDLSLADADHILTGAAASENAGIRVAAAGDVDGDGFGDLLIGANGANHAGNGTGKAYLVLAASLGAADVSLADADHALLGEAAGDFAGSAVGSAGDVDGDGLADVLVGAWGNDEGGDRAGKGYLLLAASLTGAEIQLADADHAFVGHLEGGRVGNPVASLGDLDGDGLDDVVVGSLVSATGSVHLHLAADLSGPTASTADSAWTITDPDREPGGDKTGFQLANVGDVDGDGLADVLVGGASWNMLHGRACLFYGATLSLADEISLNDADVCFLGENRFDRAGWSVGGPGDVDGDGLDDLLIGATNNDDGANNAGKAYLFLAAGLGPADEIPLADADYTFVGEAANDKAGHLVEPAGDVDGDGLADFLVLALGNDDGGNAGGKAALFLSASLGATADLSLADADIAFIGSAGLEIGDQTGLAGAGDLDGDGLDDLLIGSHDGSVGGDVGEGYVFLAADFGSQAVVNVPADAAWTITGSVSGGDAGFTIAWAGDVDGDGFDDVLMGSGGWDNNQVWLFLSGSFGATTAMWTADADYTFEGWSADPNDDRVGSMVAGAGDLDGDGLDDNQLAVRYAWDAAGGALVFLASSLGAPGSIPALDADFAIVGDAPGDTLGYYLVPAGDVDGDGLIDLLIGAPYTHLAGADTGAVQVVYSP